MTLENSVEKPFNIVVVGQRGRLQYEALLFVASLRHSSPNFTGRVFVAEPQPGDKWEKNPTIGSNNVRQALRKLGAEIVPFENREFGESYPYGNNIEALFALPEDEPFVFFDTDTLITGDLMTVPFDFERPTASLRREDTWPKIEIYGPGYTDTWKSLYDRFKLDFDSSLDLTWPNEYWQRYLYFNAGFFFYRCPHVFGRRFLEYAVEIRDNPPKELECQTFDPWLDQVALPLVIHSFGGGRDTLPPGYLDGDVSCHYRLLPLLYARESDHVIQTLEQIVEPNWIKKAVKEYQPIQKMVLQRKGEKVRELFDQDNLPRKEQAIRNRIKSNKLWVR